MLTKSKRLRVIALRDTATEMVRRDGRLVAIIERGGNSAQIAMLDRGRLSLQLWEPRCPTGIDRGETNPTTYLLEIRWDAAVVLRVGWDGERLNIISYEAGSWEGVLVKSIQ